MVFGIYNFLIYYYMQKQNKFMILINWIHLKKRSILVVQCLSHTISYLNDRSGLQFRNMRLSFKELDGHSDMVCSRIAAADERLAVGEHRWQEDWRCSDELRQDARQDTRQQEVLCSADWPRATSEFSARRWPDPQFSIGSLPAKRHCFGVFP